MHAAVWLSAADLGEVLRDSRVAGALGLSAAMQRSSVGTMSRVMVAAAAWGQTQGIYRFDETFAHELLATASNDVPGEVLTRLPEWSVWVEDRASETRAFTASFARRS